MLGFFFIVKAATRFVLFFFKKRNGERKFVSVYCLVYYSRLDMLNTPNTVFGWERRLLIIKEKEIYDV